MIVDTKNIQIEMKNFLNEVCKFQNINLMNDQILNFPDKKEKQAEKILK